MNKKYHTDDEIASEIKEFLLKVDPKMRLTQLKIIPYIILGMILAESSVKLDIAKKLKGDFSKVQLSSVVKRISRFFKNKLFNPYYFYDKIIRFVINNYKKKHDDKRVHIIFDHMFSRDNFTVFMITMRIGKQGIPLWFRCFKGNHNYDAFCESLLKEGISYVSSLFDKDYDLIFLADRWFNSTTLLEYIASLGHTFNVRLKRNIKVLVYDKKEGHKIWKTTGDLFAYEYHSNLFNDIELTESKFKVNIAISKKQDVAEPWIIATNGDTKRAIKDYGYRFGGIEPLFKNQKSNGFYMESVCNSSLEYFTCMYTMICFASLYLVILGAEYSKNSKCYKDTKIETHTVINGVKKRVMSLFNTGLTLFNIAHESSVYVRLPFKFILYDI
jgi:hypothetical protein